MPYTPKNFSSGQEMAIQRAIDRAERDKQALEASWANMPSVDLAQQDAAARIQNEIMQSQRDPRYQLGAAAFPPTTAAPTARQSQPSVPYANLIEAATNAGRDYADQQKDFGLFGNLVNNMFDSPVAAQITDRLMQVFARPEFTQTGFGVTPITSFARANYALQQSEAEAAQKSAELDAQVKVAQAKAGVKKPLTESSINLVRSAQSQKGALDLLETSLKLIAGNQLSSVGPQAIELASKIGALVGIDMGPTALTQYKQNVAQLKQKLAESRSFGRELNKQELDIVAKLITEPGSFTKDSELHNQVKSLVKKAQNDYVITARLMEQSGLNPQSLLGMPEARNQYGDVIKSRQ